ncbi:MAG TPA: protein kinase, partial [Vicinamibacteria bacterium]|nr:protein kinase [Vicinamibacteria bacterium]
LALVAGSSAGPYRIVGPLGRGGMASVYRAYEPALDRYVALKVLPREFLHDPEFAERFKREAKAIARLEHPNIVPIYNYDIDEAEGIPWMALRLVAGGSLSQLLKSELRPLPLARAIEILGGVAEALDHAHGKGIVHRDVKPQNVLLDEAGRVYLADFGIAKMVESSGGLTATGMITGTPQYMAPEQAMGGKIGPFTDVYALGIVAYEMFTGGVPFTADTPVAIAMKHVQEPLPLPPPDKVPEPILRAILKCTAKKPEDRWSSAGAFVRALEAGLEARTLPALADVPTIAVPPPAAPTVVSRRTVVPAATPSSAVTRPAGAATVRFGLGTVGLVAAGGALVLVLAAAVGVAVLQRRGDEMPTPSPSPTAEAAPAEQPSLPVVFPPSPAPTTLAVGAPQREPALSTPVGPTSRPAPGARATVPVPTPVPTPTPGPTPTPTPEPTPPPARPPEPATPAVDPEVQRLAAALSDPDAAARRRAAQDLASLGPGATPAVPALTAALGDRSADVRLRAAEAIGRVGPSARGAVPGLVQALRDADPMVQAEAAKSLGLLNEDAAAAAAPLGDALASRDVAVRREAARALARVGRGAEPALPALLAALKDKDRTVRAQAARALGRVGPAAREAVPALTALSRDSDLVVSREAQAALLSIGP